MLVVTAVAPVPEFSWTPGCPMGLVWVQGPSVGWNLIADSNRILSPVRYGEVRAGITTNGAGTQLARGTTYVVSIWRWVSGPYREVGTASFTP